MILSIIKNLIMFGFQAFSRGVLRMASRASVPQMSTYVPRHVGWAYQY
jgi:hypothetical protein